MSETNNNPPGETPSVGFRKDLIIPAPSSLHPSHLRPGARPGGEPQQGITPQFLLAAMRQWWKVAAPIGLVLAAISGAVIYLLHEPAYKASAWLRIADNAPYIAFPADDGPRRFERFVETQKQLITSPLVLGPVISQPEIGRMPEIGEKDDPIQWLSQTIEVNPVGQSELLEVSYSGPDRENSAQLVKAVVKEYLSMLGRDAAQRNQKVIELLEEERDTRAEEVNRLRENVRAMAIQAGGKDPFAVKPETEVVRHPLADLQDSLTKAEVERRILEARIKVLQEGTFQGQAEVADGMVAGAVEEDAEIRARKAELSAKRARLEEAKSRLVQPEKSEHYNRLKGEIAQDEEVLNQLRDELKKKFKAELETTLADKQEAEIADLKGQLASYELMEQILRERYEEELKDVKQGSGNTLELEFAKADLALAESVFEQIAQRAMRLRTEQRAPARITLLRPATPPNKALEWWRSKWLPLAVLATFCFPFGLAVLWERLVRRVTDAQQLEEYSNVAVVGEVARLPVRTGAPRRASSKRVGRALGIFEESIDSLRTCLILSEPLSDMKVLAVTSGTKREGKTSVAVQLALSIARASGEPTLLIDGDMRSPDIHNLLEVPLEPGLGDVLAKQCPLKDAIVSDWSQPVHLLPAGKLHASPHKLLGNGVVESLFEEIRGAYRYVVVDTPPILAAGEALVLARAADASLICAMRDVSRIDQIKKTHERLLTANARPVGIVLNGIPAKRYTYRYGNYAYSQE